MKEFLQSFRGAQLLVYCRLKDSPLSGTVVLSTDHTVLGGTPMEQQEKRKMYLKPARSATPDQWGDRVAARLLS